MSRLGFSLHRGESWMNTNVEPVLKVIAGIVLLHNPWKKKKTIVNTMRFYFVCSLTSFAISTLGLINARAAHSCSSIPIKNAESLLPNVRYCCICTGMQSWLLQQEQRALDLCSIPVSCPSTDKVNAAAPDVSNTNSGGWGYTQCTSGSADTIYYAVLV